ncbi:hypothetical protein JYT50_00405 [bacterium AH-315-A23]|nr:hypothetical protein [bacterium AH-315-A23]
MKYFISAILTIVILSCKTTDERNTAYFGGEIINPKTNFVLFLKDNKVIDTLLLDENNRFLNAYKSLNEGLYTFKHGNEFQYIYLQPADSILIRLNTWDFDESLVFSGKGSAKNEYLINLFLQNEKEEAAMHKYFHFDEQEFQLKIDSLKKIKVTIYNEFATHEVNITHGFEKLTTTAINFPLYRLKEIYPYFYKKAHHLEEFPTISDSFYDFRANINLNEGNLVSFYPYQNYIVSYLYNLSYQLEEKDPSKDDVTVNILNYTIEHIKDEAFKNTLLKAIIVNNFFKSESTCSINEKPLRIFLENCTNPEFVTIVKKLVHDSKAISTKKRLNDFEILSYNGNNLTIHEIVQGKNSVIYFWSSEFMSSDYLVSRIKHLEHTYPNILFIGINMQSFSEDLASEPNLKKLDITKQFKLTKDSKAHNYLTSNYPRIIIINDEGIVENGFTYLGSRKLSSELSKLK